jgi:polysaccharide biosynthesis/export protein
VTHRAQGRRNGSIARRIVRSCAALASVLATATVLGAQTAPAPSAPAPVREGDYVIGAGDVLQLFVWKEPELTKDVTVRLDGRITVPLLGDLEAAGKTPNKLAGEIAARLAKYLEAPQVTLGVSQPKSSRFYVMGQVAKPGDYGLDGQVTVAQALAMAGGLKDFAKASNIVIIRKAGTGQTFIRVNYKKLEAGEDLSQNVVIKPGDTVLVP